MRWPSIALVLAALACPVALPAAAQETRAAMLERQRAEKATRLEPYKAGKIEKGMLFLEERDPFRRIAPENGFYVQYGYTDKPVGAGIGFGGGFRHNLFNRHARLVTEVGASVRGYRLYRADLSLPRLAGERMEIGVEGSYRRHPQEDFYGRGIDSDPDSRVNFLYEGTDGQGRLVFKPTAWARLGTRAGYLDTSVGRGTDPRFPSIETRFGEGSAPAFIQHPTYGYAEVFAQADTRDQPGNARSGGFYDVSWRKYSDRDFNAHGFRLFNLELQQFLPIFDKKRVIALRGRFVGASADDGHTVPFFMMPTIGGPDTLRSVSDYRFRDNNVLLANAEYRWEAFSGLDMALFADIGTVGAKASDLDSFKHAYGIGLRFNTFKTVFLRIDVGTGAGEGLHVFVKYRRPF